MVLTVFLDPCQSYSYDKSRQYRASPLSWCHRNARLFNYFSSFSSIVCMSHSINSIRSDKTHSTTTKPCHHVSWESWKITASLSSQRNCVVIIFSKAFCVVSVIYCPMLDSAWLTTTGPILIAVPIIDSSLLVAFTSERTFLCELMRHVYR